MAELTEKGLARLEILRDYWPEREHYSSVLMRNKYLLQEIERNPEFLIEQHSNLRPDWERLKTQGLITETSIEEVCIPEGPGKPLEPEGSDPERPWIEAARRSVARRELRTGRPWDPLGPEEKAKRTERYAKDEVERLALDKISMDSFAVPFEQLPDLRQSTVRLAYSKGKR